MPAARRRSGFLFTSRPAPGDGSPALPEDRPGPGVRGLRKEGPASGLTRSKPPTVPAPYTRGNGRAHTCHPSLRQVSKRSQVRRPQVSRSPGPGPHLGGGGLPDPRPGRPKSGTAFRQAGVPASRQSQASLPPGSLSFSSADLPGSVLTQAGGPRPWRPLGSHPPPPGSLRAPRGPRPLFRRWRQVHGPHR